MYFQKTPTVLTCFRQLQEVLFIAQSVVVFSLWVGLILPKHFN